MPQANYTSKSGALHLKSILERFWAKQGHHPVFWIEPEHERTTNSQKEVTKFAIRSDMVDGRPV